MAPTHSALLKVAARTIILEDHILRWFTLSLTRAAYDGSLYDFEKELLQLYNIITSLKPCDKKLCSLTQLAKLAWRCIIACKVGIEFPIPAGVREFCQCLQRCKHLRAKWEPLILLCTSKSLRTWMEKEQPRADFSILKVAIENWEWTCFRHYRESFRCWAFQESPCDPCASRLRQMARYVEYDRIEVADRYLHPAGQFFSCLTNRYAKDVVVPSLEPFIMILRQAKNRRWMALWAPLIHMHTGFTVEETYHSYIESSQERDEIEEATTSPKCIPGTIFEERDLEHISDALECERFLIETQMEECRKHQGSGTGMALLTPLSSPLIRHEQRITASGGT